MKINNAHIEQVADDVLLKYVKRGGVYKVFPEIMNAEQIKFVEMSSANKNFVGIFTTSNKGQNYIMVNAAIDNSGRRNFTIAHELGHYFLAHKLKDNKGFCNNNDIQEEGSAKDPIEREANCFASYLLMPETKIKNAFLSILANSKKAKNKDFLLVKNDASFGIWTSIKETLTKRYGVSEAALRFRLQKLGLAEFEFIKHKEKTN